MADHVLPVIMAAFHDSFEYACNAASHADLFKSCAMHVADGAVYVCVRFQSLVQRHSPPDLMSRVQRADTFSVEDVFTLLEVSSGVAAVQE